MKAIILGNRKGVRRLSAGESYPSALKPAGQGTVMDINLEALTRFGVDEVVYIGGYHLEKVVSRYPAMRFYYLDGWEEKSDAQALLSAREEFTGTTLIASSNVVFRFPALQALFSRNTDTSTIACVTSENFPDLDPDEFPKMARDEYNFAGMVALSNQFAPDFASRLEDLAQSGKGTLLDSVTHQKVINNHVLVDEHWGEVIGRSGLARFMFGTKAQTLERLRPLVRESEILPQIRFSHSDWTRGREKLVQAVCRALGPGRLAARSSSVMEDSWTASHAGRFHSCLNVDGHDEQAVIQAIDKVFAGYSDLGCERADNEVLVQPQLENVSASGVLFTRDLRRGAPYYVMVYDDSTNRTDTVTSGTGDDIKTMVAFRYADASLNGGWQDRLLKAAREAEELMGFDALDMEFAVGDSGSIYLLQVRPIVLKELDQAADDRDFQAEVESIGNFLKARTGPSHRVSGRYSMFGEMPDWNPAEMIGTSPKPLALSLYQVLITDRAWADARARIGYKDLSLEPLLYSFGGKPFIDVRASFNSMVPAMLDDESSDLLVNAALDHLRDNPELHDKVEFEVMPNCLRPLFSRDEDRLTRHGVPRRNLDIIRKAYRELTDNILTCQTAPISSQLARLERLDEFRSTLAESCQDVNQLSFEIRGLVQDCVRYGTVPFSVLARYGFIAMIFLTDIRDRNILTPEEYAKFLAGIPTVASELSRDLNQLGQKQDLMTFREKYGHLRPSSYDICSADYGALIDSGRLGNGLAAKTSHEPDLAAPLNIWQVHKTEIASMLEEMKMKATPDDLFRFISQAIPARESGKFEFTKNLGAILERVAAMGSELGFNRDDMAHVSIEQIMRLATDSPASVLSGEMRRLINYQRKRHGLTRDLRLPYLMTKPEDAERFFLKKPRPNFITDKAVFGETVELGCAGSKGDHPDLAGRIVLVRAADPGYDWIFSRPLKGLITQYGGSASHMAIRAAEFGLPAAIGCGEEMYESLRGVPHVLLDCGNQTIKAKK